jgi:cytosine/adenosine deaminase-related metal-dependent hydrolase
MFENDDLNSLFSDLSGSTSWETTKAVERPKIVITEENAAQYALEKMSEVIEAGVDTIAQLKDIVVAGQNPDEIASLADIMAATSRAFEAFNKFALQSKKAQTDRELKELDIRGKKEIASLMPGTQTNVNIGIIASREEIMKELIRGVKEKECKVIEATISTDTEETL